MAITLDEATSLLSRTPQTLATLLRDLPDAWARASQGPEDWSAFDVVWHLIEGEEANWIPRTRHILARGEAEAFPAFDRFAFARRSRSPRLDDALDLFAEARRRSLDQLQALHLGPADLERRGRHPELGPVTLGHLLSSWTVHDLNHMGQIVQALAHHQAEAVGPWRVYLAILDR